MTFQKASRIQRKGAKEILRVGQKALAYRKDLLDKEQRDRLKHANEKLLGVMRAKPVLSASLEESANEVDLALRESGGLYYRKKSLVENIEMLLVAAIVVIGIRSFFIQPFIIPTNSMFPSFSGMQPNIYEDTSEVPGFFQRAVDKVLLGAAHYKLKAESSGNLYLKLQAGGSFRFARANFPDGRFFIFPTTVREYVFEIGGK